MARPGVSEARRKAFIKEKKERRKRMIRKTKNLIIESKSQNEKFKKRGSGPAGKRIKEMSEKNYFGFKNGGMLDKNKRKKVKKVISKLKKASKAHAGQARTLQRVIKKK